MNSLKWNYISVRGSLILHNASYINLSNRVIDT